MKNSKIIKIIYTLIGLITTVFVFGQEGGPEGFDEDVVDNTAGSPIDNYIIVGVLIAIFFAIYTLQRNYSSRDCSIKKQ